MSIRQDFSKDWILPTGTSRILKWDILNTDSESYWDFLNTNFRNLGHENIDIPTCFISLSAIRQTLSNS